VAKKEEYDPRLAAARYRTGGDTGGTGGTDDNETDAGAPTMEQRAQFVEIQISQAIRRGDFDDLPGAGKPLRDLGRTHDPNWWIRQKIERERLTGLGPPALTLRTEHVELEGRLDSLHTEQEVRQTLDDFNRRVIEARRQLQGGPPVVTPTRDVDAEVEGWRDRRAARARAAAEEREREAAALAAMSRRDRRRLRREQARDLRDPRR